MIKKPETSDLVAGLLCCAYEGHPENKTHVLFSLCMLYVYFLFSARESFTTEGLFCGFFVYMTNFILFKMRSCVAVLTAT